MTKKDKKIFFLAIFFALAFCVLNTVQAAGTKALNDVCIDSSECLSSYCSVAGVCATLGKTPPPPAQAKLPNGSLCKGDPTSCQSGYCPNGMCESFSPAPAADSAVGSDGSTTFRNPLAFNTVEELLTRVLVTMRQIIVLLALVFLVIGALIYITSAGESGRVETAKKAMTASMIGLAIGIAAPSFLKEISTILGWTGSSEPSVTAALTLSQIATNVLTFLLSILGVIALIMLIVSSMMYLTAAGDEERIEKGKDMFKYSLIGIVIAMASLVLVKQIAAFFV